MSIMDSRPVRPRASDDLPDHIVAAVEDYERWADKVQRAIDLDLLVELPPEIDDVGPTNYGTEVIHRVIGANGPTANVTATELVADVQDDAYATQEVEHSVREIDHALRRVVADAARSLNTMHDDGRLPNQGSGFSQASSSLQRLEREPSQLRSFLQGQARGLMRYRVAVGTDVRGAALARELAELDQRFPVGAMVYVPNQPDVPPLPIVERRRWFARIQGLSAWYDVRTLDAYEIPAEDATPG